MEKPRNSVSTHFNIEPLAEGVFAAIAEDGSAACNCGLIDLGGKIVAFDAFLTPQAAEDLRSAAIKIYGHAPQIVINSHYHSDHVWGNQVFAQEAQIISSRRTRELLATSGMEEFQWSKENSAKQLEELHEKYREAKDDQERKDLSLFIGEHAGLLEAFPRLKIIMPNITFEERLQIHGAGLTARLVAYEGGHTGSDVILQLPEAGIVFAGDLLFTNFHPYLGDGDPFKLLEALKEIVKLEADQFVPGHGLVGTIEDVKMEITYLENCIEIAREMIKSGNAEEEQINKLVIPEVFQKWEMSRFYRENIRFVCERLNAGEK